MKREMTGLFRLFLSGKEDMDDAGKNLSLPSMPLEVRGFLPDRCMRRTGPIAMTIMPG